MRTPLGVVRSFLSDAKLGRELRSVTTGGSLSSPPDWLLNALGGVTRSGAKVSEDTAFNVSTVGACINILSQSLAMLPLKVYRRTADGAEEASDHPLAQLLKRKPGVAQTSYQWRSYCQTCLCLGGNAYSRIFRNGLFEVERIEPLKASEVEVLQLASGRLVYRIRGTVLQDFEVLHFRGLSTNGLTGRSPLHDLRETVGLAMTAQTFSASTFANGNRKPGVFEGANANREKAQEFLKFYQDNYAGANNGGKSLFTFGGVTWKDAGFSNQDAELLMTRRFEVEEIARSYRVPLTLLQSMEKSTSFGTGIAELSRGFVTYTLNPWLENWQQEMEDKLLTEDEKIGARNDGVFIRFNVNALLRGNPLEQAQKAEVERRARLITVNEYRRQQDLNDFPDNIGDNPREPLNAQESAQQSGARQPAGDHVDSGVTL